MEGKFLLPSGTNSGLTLLYVDTRAATAEAEGSAMKPFRSIELAIKVCPVSIVISPEGLTEVRVIQVSGVYNDVLVDRSCAIKGLAVFSGITLCGGFNYLMDGAAYDVVISSSVAATLVNLDLNGTLEINSDTVTMRGCNLYCDTITLNPAITGTLRLENCKVNTDLVVPASWKVTAFNTYLSNASGAGTIELFNSEEGV